MKPPENIKTIEIDLLTGWVDKDGIFYAVSKDCERTIPKYEVLFELYKKLSDDGKNKICAIQDVTNTHLMSSEISNFVFDRHPKYIKAFALISNSPLGTTTGNFYIRLKPSSFPMQMFDTAEEAVSWIKQYL
jgi:hypothetical protein